MASYTKERKAEVLQRLEAPENLSIAEVARQEKIPKTTIKGWVDKTKTLEVKEEHSRKERTSEEKFHIVMETFALNESELAEYARKQGVFLADIKEWKKNCCSANEKKVKCTKEEKKSLEEVKNREKNLKNELTICKKELKSKEKQLIRKDETIAEVTALLVLKGKAQAVWGDSEDE